MLPGQKSLWQLTLVKDTTRKLTLKFGPNWVSNSWDNVDSRADIEFLWWGGLQSNFCVKPNVGCVELGLSWDVDNRPFEQSPCFLFHSFNAKCIWLISSDEVEQASSNDLGEWQETHTNFFSTNLIWAGKGVRGQSTSSVGKLRNFRYQTSDGHQTSLKYKFSYCCLVKRNKSAQSILSKIVVVLLSLRTPFSKQPNLSKLIFSDLQCFSNRFFWWPKNVYF